VSFLASVHFEFDPVQAEPEVYTMICSAKAPTELRRVENFDADGGELRVGVYFQMLDLYSIIVSYINQNFSMLVNDPDIKLLRKDEFKLLLKHKYVHVVQEDDVVKAICQWLKGHQAQQVKQKYHATTLS
jgi:hypothetical protein